MWIRSDNNGVVNLDGCNGIWVDTKETTLYASRPNEAKPIILMVNRDLSLLAKVQEGLEKAMGIRDAVSEIESFKNYDYESF